MLGYVKIGATKLKNENKRSDINVTARLRFHPPPKGRGLLAVTPRSLR